LALYPLLRVKLSTFLVRMRQKAVSLLRYRTYPVAIVEAKAESHLARMQQAKEYAARAEAFLNRNQDFPGPACTLPQTALIQLVFGYRDIAGVLFPGSYPFIAAPGWF